MNKKSKNQYASPVVADMPLSPHVWIYRRTILMIMSGLHRLTGLALYFGMAFLAWWLFSLTSPELGYADFSWFAHSFVGRAIFFGLSWCLIHHMIGGIRHFIWDAGWCLDLPEAKLLAWATITSSLILTLLLWLVACG